MRMFYSLIQFYIYEVYNRLILIKKPLQNENKSCTRCKNNKYNIEDSHICLNCHISVYCSIECLKRNKPIHDQICKIFFLKNKEILKIVDIISKNIQTFTHKKRYKDKIQQYDEHLFN